MKFGGTSVKDAGYSKICDLLSNFRNNDIVVVVSALRGVTDGLLESTRRAESGEATWIDDFLLELRAMHVSVAKGSMGAVPSWLEEGLSKADRELEQVLYGILHLKEATPRSIDYVMSFGERYSAEIAAATLANNGFRSKPFTGGEVGIITNGRFGEATPVIDVTRERVRSALRPLLDDGFVPVVGGFSGMTEDGLVTTFGRGGSDYTAAILADAIDADEVMIWTDVNGIMTADPKIVPDAVSLREIAYDEAMEMAVLGAKSLHPRALEPVMEKKIPVRLKNTFNPEHEGTAIVNELSRPYPLVVKVISLIRDVGTLTIRGASMVGKPGTAARFFSKLAEAEINIMMISQSVSESNISVVMKRQFLGRAYEIINEDIGKDARKLEVESDIAVVAAVGEGMKGTSGVAARIFRAVSDANINVSMIASGSNEMSISFVVNEADGARAVRALHREFIEKDPSGHSSQRNN